MSDNTDSLDDQPGSPWTQKGFIAAAVVVGLLIILGAVLVITRPSDGDDRADPGPQPTTSTPAPTATSSASTPSTDSACGLPAGDQAVPVTAPPKTEWELVGTIAVPSAPETHGPGQIEDGLRSCFARTPTGALYAAANLVASTSVPELREPVVRMLGAEGPERDRALELLASDDAPATSGVQIAGFTFLNYDGETTTVDLAVRALSGASQVGYAHIPVTLRWEEGDWKVVFGADGALGAGTGPIPDLAGYVPWAGA